MGKSQKTPPLAVGMNGKAGDLEAAAPRGFSLKKPRRFAPGSFTEMIRHFTYWRDLCKNALSSPESAL
jgi:hypothetical protein